MGEINTWPGWQCVRQLGAGSFGKVYEIEKREGNYIYKAALKVISIPQNQAELENAYSEGMTVENATAYFKGFVNELSNENALMASLKGYTNIVSYEDHMILERKDAFGWNFGWDILIRMELLTPLQKWCKTNPLTEKEVLRLGIDLCKALELCHKKNIIHRDIKPQNIFVNDNGDFKLGDFGIARVTEKTMSAMSQKGTYTYMAPEVYRGQKYNQKVDIYSLGIVLYSLLNQNRVPFLPLGMITYSDKQMAQERRMSGETIPAPLNGSLELKMLILKALQYNPNNRFQNAYEFRMALEKCLYDMEGKGRSGMQISDSSQILTPPGIKTPPVPPMHRTWDQTATGTVQLLADDQDEKRSRLFINIDNYEENENLVSNVESGNGYRIMDEGVKPGPPKGIKVPPKNTKVPSENDFENTVLFDERFIRKEASSEREEKESFWQKYKEKLILGICAVFVIGLIILAIIGTKVDEPEEVSENKQTETDAKQTETDAEEKANENTDNKEETIIEASTDVINLFEVGDSVDFYITVTANSGGYLKYDYSYENVIDVKFRERDGNTFYYTVTKTATTGAFPEGKITFSAESEDRSIVYAEKSILVRMD